MAIHCKKAQFRLRHWAFVILSSFALSHSSLPVQAADTPAKPPVYLWLEAEWFDGIEGSFAYWPGESETKPTGKWRVAGPGIGPEWTQGGESEWNSMGVPASETKAVCSRDIRVGRAGKYRLWVRYVDHRKKTEPFSVRVLQDGKDAIKGELGIKPIVPANDEYQLYWGFSFGWGSLEGELAAGPAKIELVIDKAGEAWRQVDALLLTDDLKYEPHGREKPPFLYFESFALKPGDGPAWRGSGKDIKVGADWKRPQIGGRDFTMWTGIDLDPKWWAKQKPESMSLYDALFHSAPGHDIRAHFHKQFEGKKDVPIVSWPGLRPGLYLGSTPDLSTGAPLRKWLEQTKAPFYIMTNYANPQYTDKTGPETYAALTGPLAGQFLGYIHGEAIGTGGVGGPEKQTGKNRREHVDAFARQVKKSQAESWSKIYKTPVADTHIDKSVSCLSVDSIALCHLFQDLGMKMTGYEEDSTNLHVPMRIAFERGAARQYGGSWMNYASGNFGDSCNYFTQEPQVPRGAKSWYHSKYAVTDGVSAAWYRKLYYLNYLSGAAAIHWEQSLVNQWLLPGPGKHPIQLSPFGRGTEDFLACVERLPDRGEPLTPVAILLSYGHGYEPVNYRCKMLNVFGEAATDRELRELFNVCWYPSAISEGRPAAPDVQSMPGGIYGNIFDVLVDRAAHGKAIFNYPVVWAAGDVDLAGGMAPIVEEYLRKGGTLVVNVEAARALPEKLLGLKLTGKRTLAEEWAPEGGQPRPATAFEVEGVELGKAKVLAWANPKTPLITRHAVGEGAVILTLVPHLLGLDERAHPALPFLMTGLTERLLPVTVRGADGQPVAGKIMYQVNRTKDGYLVMLMNNRGIDKTPNGVARVNRRAFVDVVVEGPAAVKSAKEFTEPRDLQLKAGSVSLRVHPGDVQVVHLRLQ
jgi:hypothetical protein